MSKSPTPKTQKTEQDDSAVAYQFEAQFNAKAQLVNINYTEDMTLAQVRDHLKVAADFLAHQVTE